MELALLGLNNKDCAARLPCDRKTLSRFVVRARARRQALMKLQDFRAAVHGEGEALRRLLQARDDLAGSRAATPPLPGADK